MNAQCINTYCLYMSEQAEQAACERCGCSLVIRERFRATSLLSHYNMLSSQRTQTFGAIDLATREEVILRVVQSGQENLVRPLKDAVIALRQVHAVSTHPGIMRLIEDEEFGYFTWEILPGEPQAHCMVTEKVPGVNLQKWVDTSTAIDETLVRDWLQQLLEAVRELHLAHFLHRDIKPENIIVTGTRQLVLIDFDAICSMDWPVSSMGTAAYMAPEQAAGKPRPASDLYSIGRLTAELLTGKLFADIAKIPGTNKVDWRKESPKTTKQLTTLVDKLANKNTVYRPDNADEALSFLAELEADIAISQKWRWINNAVTRTAIVILSFSAFIGIGASFSQTQTEADKLLAEGNQLIIGGESSEGIVLIEEAIALEPDSVELISSLAIAQAFLGDLDASISNYERALEIDPDNPYLYYNLANVYEQVDTDTAISYYIAASEVDSSIRSNALNNLSRVYLLTDQLQSAEDTLSIFPENTGDPRTRAAFFKNSGWLSYLKEDFETAERQLAQSIEAYPYQPDPYCLLALIQKKTGKDNFNDQSTCLNAPAQTNKPEIQSWRLQLTY